MRPALWLSEASAQPRGLTMRGSSAGRFRIRSKASCSINSPKWKSPASTPASRTAVSGTGMKRISSSHAVRLPPKPFGASARAEAPNGFGGKRTAWLDEILFIPVPDTAVRLAGVEAGDFHFGLFIEQDAFERIRNRPALEPRIVKPRGWALASLNHKSGLMTSKPLRQAVQAALDMEPIMRAGFGHKDFYRLQPGLFFPEQPWHSTVGAHLYNQRDRDKAQRLLKEAAYRRQPVRWITNREYEFMYKTAVVA